MRTLYRNPFLLPSLAVLALLPVGCDQPAVPGTASGPIPDVHLEAMQDAEALKYAVEERQLEKQRIDQLLGRGQTAPR